MNAYQKLCLRCIEILNYDSVDIDYHLSYCDFIHALWRYVMENPWQSDILDISFNVKGDYMYFRLSYADSFAVPLWQPIHMRTDYILNNLLELLSW